MSAHGSDSWPGYGLRQERDDLLRALAGGAIVGMPLLYTMEMWHRGATLSPWHELGILGATLIVNFFLCWIIGFREEHSAFEGAIEAVTSVGIGLLFALFILWLIGEIRSLSDLRDGAGKVLLEAAAVSIGVSFANARRGESRTGNEHEKQPKPDRGELERRQLREDLCDIGATVAGSTLFSLNIAPTEEVVLIATRLGPFSQLALLLAMIGLCYVILYGSGFEDQPVHVQGLFQTPWAETVMTVAVSLLSAAALLWLLGEPRHVSSPGSFIGCVLVLGLPAIVGGAAGRLVI